MIHEKFLKRNSNRVEFLMNNTLKITALLVILPLFVVSLTQGYFTEAAAQIGQGTSGRHYGHETSTIVCGDKLCSQVSVQHAKSADKTAADKKAADMKAAADKKAADMKAAADKKAPDMKASSTSPSNTITVTMAKGSSSDSKCADKCYTPSILQIKVGDTVTWNNADTAAHTVTSGKDATSDGLFDSGMITVGSSFNHKFDKTGTYDYYCMVHPWMKGQVIVS